MNDNFNVLAIMRGTTVDGPGFRTSIYLAGCCHHCPGCHNPGSWNPHEGTIMTINEIMDIVREEDFDVTLSGGDPLFSPAKTERLVNELKADGRNVWVYTGYTWEEIIADPNLLSAIRNADAVVDGPFIESLKDPDLYFRGSSNQRIINVVDTLKTGAVTIHNVI